MAIAEGGRTGEVRFMGDVENNPAPIERTIKRLANRYDRLHVCFEAWPTGYGLYRQVQALGHDCMVVAPALIPKRAGERIKSNRRDAVTLARLHRAGELTGVSAPDPAHEAVRDLVRARKAAGNDLRRNASNCFPSCCVTVGFTAAAATGRWRIGAGSRVRSSITLRSRSSFRKPSTRSRTRSNACVASRSNSLSSCRNGRWRQSWRLIRRCAALRFSSP